MGRNLHTGGGETLRHRRPQATDTKRHEQAYRRGTHETPREFSCCQGQVKRWICRRCQAKEEHLNLMIGVTITMTGRGAQRRSERKKRKRHQKQHTRNSPHFT